MLAFTSCNPGTITITTGDGDGGHQEQEGDSSSEGSSDEGSSSDVSTGSAGVATTSEGSTTGAEVATGEGGSGQQSDDSTTTDGPLGCSEAELGEFDWIYGGCCEQATTCTSWCAEHGFGQCLFVGLYEGPACSDEVQYAPVCDEDPWAYFDPAPFGVQCVCALPS